EEVVEDLRHQVPGGAGVEAEAVALPGAGTAAELLPRLDQIHLVAVAGEQRGGGEAGDPAADHHHRVAPRGHIPASARAACRAQRRPASTARASTSAFSGSLTRTRARRICAAGVVRSRLESAA